MLRHGERTQPIETRLLVYIWEGTRMGCYSSHRHIWHMPRSVDGLTKKKKKRKLPKRVERIARGVKRSNPGISKSRSIAIAQAQAKKSKKKRKRKKR